MDSRSLRADALLLLTAVIWGAAFVAQRMGMDNVGPLTFNGIRFLLGALALVPLARSRRRAAAATAAAGGKAPATDLADYLQPCGVAGVALFTGATMQQVGLVYTTAGKAGFITGLYVVIVPLLGLLWRQRTPWSTWCGAALAVAGLYFLTMSENLSLAEGDALVLIGALFWAGHVLAIGWLSGRQVEPVLLACLQFLICAVLSLAVAGFSEAATFTLTALWDAALPILYGGLLSVGVAYTLQVVGQRHAPPAHAAIILSLETVFAALGGWLLLQETLSGRGLIGCALMFAGMLLSQLGKGRSASPTGPVAATASSLVADEGDHS